MDVTQNQKEIIEVEGDAAIGFPHVFNQMRSEAQAKNLLCIDDGGQ